MILFKPEMAAAILSGQKICTRRRGRKRWNVGAIHQCYTRMPWGKEPGKPFARVRIVSVTWESNPGASILLAGNPPDTPDYDKWGSALQSEGVREGFSDWVAFGDAYELINGPQSIYAPCWRVAFELVRDGQ